jgi:hypothetical protein
LQYYINLIIKRPALNSILKVFHINNLLTSCGDIFI